MQRKMAVFFLLATAAFVFADTSAVTTQPTSSELEDLRTRVRALEQENDLLRSELAAAGKALPQPATADDKVVVGVEGLLEEFPSNELPGPDEGTNDLRHSLLAKWVQNHVVGRTVTLHGRFLTASAISNNAFDVHIASKGSERAGARPFEATMSLPELEAPTVVDFRRGMTVETTGQVAEVQILRTSEGGFSLSLRLVHALIKADGSPPGDSMKSPRDGPGHY